MANHILLGSGTYFDYQHPETSRLTIEDIAYGLAMPGASPVSADLVKPANGFTTP